MTAQVDSPELVKSPTHHGHVCAPADVTHTSSGIALDACIVSCIGISLCEYVSATPSAVAAATCWIRMPTGCDRTMVETTTPREWFVDPVPAPPPPAPPPAPHTNVTCLARIAVLNTLCHRTDAEHHWGTDPGPIKYECVGCNLAPSVAETGAQVYTRRGEPSLIGLFAP